MQKKFLSLIYFTITIAVLIAVLKIINWLPLAVQDDTMRNYSSIEKVKSKLHLKTVYVPSYFPQNLVWPPSKILAQLKPFTAVIMHFNYRDSKEIGLVIHQESAIAPYHYEPMIKIRKIKGRSRVLIKDREGTLVSAFCENETPCNQVSWKEGEYLITVTTKAAQKDLIRISRSMIPDF